MNEWVDRLARVECPAFTARRARRGELAGAPHDPIVWARAEGEHVWDTDGRRYVDLTAGFAVACLGHNHPTVRASIEEQLGTLWHALGDVHPSDQKIVLMERLARMSPFESARVILGLNGSDAVDAALKTAQLHTKKPGVIAFEGGYHGLATGPLAVAGYKSTFRAPFEATLNPHVDFVSFPREESDLPRLQRALDELDLSQIGALLFEPVQGRGGIHIPPAGFLPLLRRFCNVHSLVLIADEIMTGFGRTGSLWASTANGQRPDLLCVGKALGGGLPLSACIGDAEVMQAWGAPDGEALHTATFFGNPLACAAALGFLRAFEEEGAVELGQRQAQKLYAALSRPFGPTRARHAGMMLALKLGEAGAGLRISHALQQEGFLVLPNGADASGIQLTPPLNLSDEAIKSFSNTLENCIDQYRIATP